MSRLNPLLQNARAYLPLGRRSAVVTIQLLAACHLLTTDVLEIRLCAGFSMLPTFSHSGDFVLISPIPAKLHQSSRSSAAQGRIGSDADGYASWWRGIRRGDVVVATSPTDPGKTVCKRILAMEGDVIEVDPSSKRRTASAAAAAAVSNDGERTPVAAVKKRQSSRSFSPGKDDPLTLLDVDSEEWSSALVVDGDLVTTDLGAAGVGQHHSAATSRRGGDDDAAESIISPAARYDRRNARRWEEVDADHRQAERRQRASQSASAKSSPHDDEATAPLGPAVFPRSSSASSPSTHLRIPRGYVWLAGDNASNSTDSRAYGPVPLGLIKGKVLARAWPNPRWIARSDEGVRVIKDF